MATSHKGYRFSEETLNQIEWLARRKKATATDVIREAVDQVYKDEWAKIPKALLVDKGDHYELMAKGEYLIGVSKEFPKNLPAEFRDQLFQGEAGLGDVILYFMLGAVKGKEDMIVNPDAWEKLTDLQL